MTLCELQEINPSHKNQIVMNCKALRITNFSALHTLPTEVKTIAHRNVQVGARYWSFKKGLHRLNIAQELSEVFVLLLSYQNRYTV